MFFPWLGLQFSNSFRLGSLPPVTVCGVQFLLNFRVWFSQRKFFGFSRSVKNHLPRVYKLSRSSQDSFPLCSFSLLLQFNTTWYSFLLSSFSLLFRSDPTRQSKILRRFKRSIFYVNNFRFLFMEFRTCWFYLNSYGQELSNKTQP